MCELGEGVRVETLEVWQVLHGEGLQLGEAVEGLLGQDAHRVEGEVQALQVGKVVPAVGGQVRELWNFPIFVIMYT